MRILLFISFAALVSVSLAFCDSTTNQSTQIANVRQTVETFCKSEFDAGEFEQRAKVVRFSPERQQTEKRRSGPASPYVVFWLWDPLFVVTSYDIKDIQIDGKNAVASIAYNRVAESNGRGEIISSNKYPDIVTLNLAYEDNNWWVIDPPLPRVSLKVLIQLYDDNINSRTSKWLEQASDAQKKEYYKKVEGLKTLNSIASHIN
jgi:hypothetical protein